MGNPNDKMCTTHNVGYPLSLLFCLQLIYDLVTTPHGNVSFVCVARTPTVTGVQWLVNNMTIEDIDNINITTEFSNDYGIGIGRLNLTNIPLAYNKTSITCIAQSASGQEEVTASLLIQGLCNT